MFRAFCIFTFDKLTMTIRHLRSRCKIFSSKMRISLPSDSDSFAGFAQLVLSFCRILPGFSVCALCAWRNYAMPCRAASWALQFPFFGTHLIINSANG